MASMFVTLISLLLALNLLLFTTVSSTCCPSSPKPEPKCQCPPRPKGTCPKDTCPYFTCPNDTCPKVTCPKVTCPKVTCPEDGAPPTTPCCSLIEGLSDDKATACPCTAIKAQVLGVQLDVPVSLSLLLNYCGKKVPSGFQCA